MELFTGLGLATASGLNAYIPLLAMGLLGRFTNLVELPHPWAWLTNGWVIGIVAGFVAVVPLYVLGLLSSYFATRTITTQAYGQSAGTYDHYFNLFLPPADVLWSFGKVLVFAFVIILVHCYYGYYASGGPAGVGVAVGHAVRAALVLIAVLDFFLGLAIWGTTTTVRVGG